MYNLFTCGGFENVGYFDFGPCFKARLGIVLLFFIIALIRKWGGEEIGLDFNFPISLTVGLLLYFIIVSFTGSLGASFALGIAGALGGGYLSGFIIGGEEE